MMHKQESLPKNVCEVVSNYCTSAPQSVLAGYGKQGHKIVSVVMAKNQYGAKPCICSSRWINRRSKWEI